MVHYLCDLVDSIIDQICQRVPSIPVTIRVFCKAVVDKNQDMFLSQKMMAKFIIEDWLSKVAFQEMVTHGLLKSYYIRNTNDKNIKLMGIILNKMFQLDGTSFEMEGFLQFHNLFNQKKDKIKMFYKELVDVPDIKNLSLDSIFDKQAGTKFHHHSMCLTLDHII
jgi:hypothetical protein